MKKIYRILRYEWPLHLILFFTSIFPDNVIFVRLRGFLARPFLINVEKSLDWQKCILLQPF